MRRALIWLFIITTTSSISAQEDGQWYTVNTGTIAGRMADVVHDGEHWIALGAQGRLWESSEGLMWAESQLPVDGHSFRLAAGRGRLLVAFDLGNGGYDYHSLLVRDEAGSWHPATGAMPLVTDIAWDGEQFIAVGGNPGGWLYGGLPSASLATSPDGLEWTRQLYADDGGPAWEVEIGAGVRLVVGWPTGNPDRPVTALISDDGATWAELALDFDPEYLVFDGRQFVATDAMANFTSTESRIMTSPDGRIWGESGAIFPEYATDLDCRLSHCLATGYQGRMWWLDLIEGTETVVDPATDVDLQAIACAAGRCVAAGDGATLTTGPVGPDSWQVVATEVMPRFRGVAVHDGRWVAVGQRVRPSPVALWSDNAGAWHPSTAPDTIDRLSDVAWFNHVFAAVGDGGMLATTPDGSEWTEARSPTTADLRAITTSPTAAVAVGGGDRAAVIVSHDGLGWTDVAPFTPSLWDVVWDGDHFTAVGDDGVMVASIDGSTWTVEDSGLDCDLRWIASNGRREIVGCSDRSTASRVNHGPWSPGRRGAVGDVGVTWTGRAFTWIRNTSVGSSPDGLTWFSETHGLFAAAARNGRSLAAVGRDGKIIRRDGFASVTDAAPNWSLLPVVVHADGRGDVRWRSDLVFDSDAAAAPSLFLLTGGDLGGDSKPRELGADATTGVLTDVALETFGDSSVAAPLVALSQAPLDMMAVVTSDGPHGRRRQLIHATHTPPDVDPEVLPLVGLDSQQRANLWLANPTETAITSRVELVADDGSTTGDLITEIPPFSAHQVEDVVTILGGGAAQVLRITSVSGTTAAAVVSILDRVSGDPVTVQSAEASESALAIPVVAHSAGFGGAAWRSDLLLHNPGPMMARFRIELRKTGPSATPMTSPTLELGAGHSVAYDDIVDSVFHTAGVGWLRVVVESGQLTGACRITDDARLGASGMLVPALDEAAIADDSVQWLGALPVSTTDDGARRATVDIVNLGPAPATFQIVIEIPASGQTPTWSTTRVEGLTQARLVFDVDDLLTGPQPAGEALLAVHVSREPNSGSTSYHPRFVAGASTVDPTSGDTIYTAGRSR